MKARLHMRPRWLAYIALPLIAACATTQAPEPRVVIQRVEVPVDDPRCAREALARLRSEAVDFPDTDEALRNAESVFAGTQLLLAGRLLRIARLGAWEAAVAACAE